MLTKLFTFDEQFSNKNAQQVEAVHTTPNTHDCRSTAMYVVQFVVKFAFEIAWMLLRSHASNRHHGSNAHQ